MVAPYKVILFVLSTYRSSVSSIYLCRSNRRPVWLVPWIIGFLCKIPASGIVYTWYASISYRYILIDFIRVTSEQSKVMRQRDRSYFIKALFMLFNSFYDFHIKRKISVQYIGVYVIVCPDLG